MPDAVLERADEIELVDLSPEELLERLAEGKVYVPEQAARAARELLPARQPARAARARAAPHRRARRRRRAAPIAASTASTTPWPTRERILVCVGPSPGSERLIRATKRMAEGLHAPWTAAHVDVIGAPPLGDTRSRARSRRTCGSPSRSAARSCGCAGTTVAEALLAYAREHNVTRIVAGKPTHPRWRDRLRGSMLDA